MSKVLLTGAGAPGGPGILKSLLGHDDIELFICDADEEATGRYLLPDKFHTIPKAGNKDFIPKVIALCKQLDIDIIVPIVTLELLVLSEYIHLFDEMGVKVIVSDHASLLVANNKCTLYSHLHQHHVPVPAFRIVTEMGQFVDAVKSLGYPDKPFCIKPGLSNGSRGVRIVDNNIDKADLFFNHKPNSLYTTYEDLVAILESAPFPEMLISEVLPGEELTIDTIVAEGVPLFILPRRRLKMNSGISVKGEFIQDSTVISYVEQILSTMHLNGPIGIQVKRDSNNEYKILEINPRLQGTTVSAMALGLNLPKKVVELAQGRKPDFPATSDIKWGAKFARYYEEIFF